MNGECCSAINLGIGSVVFGRITSVQGGKALRVRISVQIKSQVSPCAQFLPERGEGKLAKFTIKLYIMSIITAYDREFQQSRMISLVCPIRVVEEFGSCWLRQFEWAHCINKSFMSCVWIFWWFWTSDSAYWSCRLAAIHSPWNFQDGGEEWRQNVKAPSQHGGASPQFNARASQSTPHTTPTVKITIEFNFWLLLLHSWLHHRKFIIFAFVLLVSSNTRAWHD